VLEGLWTKRSTENKNAKKADNADPVLGKIRIQKTLQEGVDFIPTAQPGVVFTMILYGVTIPGDRQP
jgi:hypothetical protein